MRIGSLDGLTVDGRWGIRNIRRGLGSPAGPTERRRRIAALASALDRLSGRGNSAYPRAKSQSKFRATVSPTPARLPAPDPLAISARGAAPRRAVSLSGRWSALRVTGWCAWPSAILRL